MASKKRTDVVNELAIDPNPMNEEEMMIEDETMNEDDVIDVLLVNRLEGYLAAQSGEHTEAERLTGRAIEIAATIDRYEDRTRTYVWHARTLALVGKPREAREAAATALAIYEAKGDLTASAWARELLDSLAT